MIADQPQQSPHQRNAKWVVGSRVVGIVATLAGNILAARILGPASYGVYLLITTALTLGTMLAMSGLDEVAVRFVSENLGRNAPDRAKSYAVRILRTLAVTSLAASILVGCSLYSMSAQLSNYGDALAIAALTASGVLLLSWQKVGAELLRGYANLKLASLYTGGVTGGPVSNVLFLGLLLLGYVGISWFTLTPSSLATVLFFTVISVAITLPWVLVGLRATMRLHGGSAPAVVLTPTEKGIMTSVSLTLLVNQLLSFGTQQFDIWLGAICLSPTELGVYGAAKRCLLISAMPVQMAMMTILATIPRLHSQHRSAELQQILRSTATYAAIPSLAALGLLALFPEMVLTLVFGESYAGAGPTVVVLTLGYLCLIVLGNPPPVLVMTGHQSAVLLVNLFATITLLVVGYVGARLYGSLGLAVGSTASLVVQNALLWWWARRKLGIWTHVGRPLWHSTSNTDISATT
ncbi:lipopolysaccharide biosynthesis protein [Aureliella helgolandensis]|uniref:Polysaccharide biosynthesis protein n=1 Tax=Aureliella helgolandensis TaxID=2527968 RepID=A0A518G7Z7_9BACT|nr:lipopolysaccharide biosynthesis protein [Aureliella helgolandensis]QDV24718.1 Polysaccharide biosynthesis protein [Aureliella helgolandensis]